MQACARLLLVASDLKTFSGSAKKSYTCLNLRQPLVFSKIVSLFRKIDEGFVIFNSLQQHNNQIAFIKTSQIEGGSK